MLLKFTPKVDHLKCVLLTPAKGTVVTKTMVRLLPGTNEVTDNEWKAMRNNIATELKSGEITILAQKVKNDKGKEIKAKDLNELPANVAVSYVADCMNPDTLAKWYKEVTNEEVRLAITRKFKKLEIDIPEDEVEGVSDGTPMSLAEFDEDEKENSEDNLLDDDLTDEDFSNMKKDELKAKCEELGIDTSDFSKKEDYVEALKNLSEE